MPYIDYNVGWGRQNKFEHACSEILENWKRWRIKSWKN